MEARHHRALDVRSRAWLVRGDTQCEMRAQRSGDDLYDDSGSHMLRHFRGTWDAGKLIGSGSFATNEEDGAQGGILEYVQNSGTFQ